MSQERNQYFYDKYIHYGWSNTITQNCMFGQKDNSPNDYMYNETTLSLLNVYPANCLI